MFYLVSDALKPDDEYGKAWIARKIILLDIQK